MGHRAHGDKEEQGMLRWILGVATAWVLLLGSAAWAEDEGSRSRPGEVPDDARIQLPNQWSLDPAGDRRPLGSFPMNMRISPDGKYLVVLHCGAGEHELMVFRTSDHRRLSRVSIPNAYYGLVFTPDGSKLYVSGGDDEIVYEYPFADGYLQAPRVIPVHAPDEDPKKVRHVPCGLALAPDGRLVVAKSWGNRVEAGSLSDYPATRIGLDFETESRPYDIKVVGAGAYASLWGKASVVRLDESGVVKTIATGDHPNELAVTADGARLFVANANVNTVSVIDTATDTVVETLNTAMYPDSLEGSTPNSLDISPDGKRLYVANADNNCVAVFDISEPGRTRALGLIPVGWYPTSVRVTPDNKTIYVANAKGFSSFANPQGPQPYLRGGLRRTTEQYLGKLLQGSLSIIPVPTEEELAAYTQRVYACSPYREDKQPVARRPEGSPVPAKVGDPSPIKHCLYIIKENRTYDHIFGDMPEGNGDPDLCLFPEKFTPNHHALAREYVLLDNFYVESQVSADGHEWTMGAYATDFVQKTWPSSYGGHGLTYPSEGAFPTAFPTAGYLWDRCIQAGVSFHSFGEFVFHDGPVGTPGKTGVPSLEGHYDPLYRGWDLDFPDVKRAEHFIEKFNGFVERGDLPSLIIMRLPNDHTTGSSVGKLTPRSMVADNDLALGMVVEAVSKSPVWKETAIFVVEDDAQNGSDHVDAHRTVALVISPYTRGRGLDSTFYSTASMLRTMELILGLEPMSQYDAGARPMYNTFRNEPDTTPYGCRPVPEELRTRVNGPDAWGAELSAQLNFEKEDAADDLLFNEIIWRNVKGADSPMPAPVRAAFIRPIDED
jgi:YVTN family beta-propeller protein